MKIKINFNKLLKVLSVFMLLLTLLNGTIDISVSAKNSEGELYNNSATLNRSTINYEELYTVSSVTGGVKITGINTVYLETMVKDSEERYLVDLYFPKQLNGKDIVEIDSRAFSINFAPKYNITGDIEFATDSVITRIGDSAFQYVDLIGDLLLPDSIEHIGSYAFQDTDLNGVLTLPKNEKFTTLSSQVFYGTTLKITNDTIPNNIKVIGFNALRGTIFPTDFIVPEGVEEIYRGNFSSSNVSNVQFPSTLKKLDGQFISGSNIKWVQIKSTDFIIVDRYGNEQIGKPFYVRSGEGNATFVLENTTIHSYLEPLVNGSVDNTKSLTYKKELRFNGTDVTREVLHNKPINLVEVDGKIAWETDATFKMPSTTGANNGWSWSNQEQQVAANEVTETSIASGRVLYQTILNNLDYVRTQHEYLEFGEYQQKYLTDSFSGTPEEIAAIIAEAEGQGKKVKSLDLGYGDIRYFTVEPVLWRILGEDSEGKTVLLSEYTMANLQINSIPTSDFDSSDLNKWLQEDFAVNTFGADNIINMDIETTIMNYAFSRNTTLFPNTAYLLTEVTDYADIVPIGASDYSRYQWLRDAYTAAAYGDTYNYAYNAKIDPAAIPDTSKAGVRPLVAIDISEYGKINTGTFEDPYHLVKGEVKEVEITPENAEVNIGKTQEFKAELTYTGPVDQTVTWTLEGDYHPDTRIDENGVLYISPNETATTITVKATSNADNSKFDTVTVNVTKNAEYIIEHYNQLPNGSYSNKPSRTEVVKGEFANTVITVIPKPSKGYEFDKNNPNNLLRTLVSPSEQSVFKIYYLLKETVVDPGDDNNNQDEDDETEIEVEDKFTITFETNGDYEIDDIVDLNAGEIINLPIMTKEGYTFSGWKIASTGEVIAYPYQIVMPENDLELIAVWTENKVVIETGEGNSWALLSVISGLVTLIAGLFAMIKRRIFNLLLSLLILLSIIITIFTQDFTAEMIFIDLPSCVITVIAIIQIISVAKLLNVERNEEL